MFTPEEMILFAEFVKENVKGQPESYGEGEITMNMKNCNMKMWNMEGTEKVGWLDYLKEALHGKVEFVCGGDGHWTTIRLLETGKTYYQEEYTFEYQGKMIHRKGQHRLTLEEAERDAESTRNWLKDNNVSVKVNKVVFGE